MPQADTRPGELKNTGYEIFVGILSILSIVNIVLRYAAQDDNLDQILLVMNVLLSVIFLVDFPSSSSRSSGSSASSASPGSSTTTASSTSPAP